MIKPKDKQLDVKIENGKLEISIGVATLCNALEYGLSLNYGDVTIIDQYIFIKEVLTELRLEEEDGSTLVHRMFDKAARKAIESGCEGVDIQDD